MAVWPGSLRSSWNRKAKERNQYDQDQELSPIPVKRVEEIGTREVNITK